MKIKNKLWSYLLIFLIILGVLSFLFINKTIDIEIGSTFFEEKEDVVFNNNNNFYWISAVIDNHNYAYPQFGLSRADIVYDIPAEGGINRYLAFFRSDLEGDFKIGPIRSARPYFLDIAKDYDSLLLHCGGSPEALARIAKEKLNTLNEFYNSYYFERYSAYRSPHNLLADFSKIKEYLEKKELGVSDFSHWNFKENNLVIGDDFSVGVKNINSGVWQAKWEYDQDNNCYNKKKSSDDYKDDDGVIIRANNLVFQFVDSQILDEVLRLKIDLVGEGEAIVCNKARCQEVDWKKKSDGGTVYYIDEEEFVFSPGKTWIHLINKQSSINFSNN